MKEWRLDELTHARVREREFAVAVVPIGATEPHGLHVPYGSDTFHATQVADLCCEAAHQQGAKVILLPTIPYGVDSNLLAFPMAIHVGQPVLDAMVTDIIRSLERHGIRKIVLFNGHGGNAFKPLLRELFGKTQVPSFPRPSTPDPLPPSTPRPSTPDPLPWVCLVDWWKVAKDRLGEILVHPGDHADEFETSVDLALFGDLVHMEDADDGATRPCRFEAVNRGWVEVTRPWHLVTKNAGVGDPRLATAEKGRRIIDIVVQRLGQFLKELSDAKMDERFPY
jgi:creatinine amidohydrolase